MGYVFIRSGWNLPLPDDEESRSRLPQAVLTAMEEIRAAVRRRSELGADYANRDALYAEGDVADEEAIAQAMREGAELPELTHGAKAAKRVHASQLASQAAGRIVEEKVGGFLASLREVVELPGELDKEADRIPTAIDEQLSKIGESMRKWFWYKSLAQYVTDVQAERDPHAVNVKGDDQKVLMAVTTLRGAVRMATRGATLDDKIAAGVIFNPPMDTTPLRPDPRVVDGKTVFVRP